MECEKIFDKYLVDKVCIRPNLTINFLKDKDLILYK